jgi:hypothetical protein
MRKLPPNVIDCSILWKRSSPAFSEALNILVAGATLARDEEASRDAAAEVQPDATVALNCGSAAAGIGYVLGYGSLAYGDQVHEFSITGISIGDAGAAKITTTGNVYNLRKLSDFEGSYQLAAAELTIAGGGCAVYLRNEHSVVINLSSSNAGRRFNLLGKGVNITLKS